MIIKLLEYWDLFYFCKLQTHSDDARPITVKSIDLFKIAANYLVADLIFNLIFNFLYFCIIC